MKPTIHSPFFVFNIKAYLYGDAAVDMARHCDALAKTYDTDIIFTAQPADLYRVAQATERILVTAQHMDPIAPGRGMGKILPESLKAAGAQAVVLNHAECPMAFANLSQAVSRARALDMLSIVCADTPEESRAIATLNPDIMICEPSALIGTGTTSSMDYVQSTLQAVRAVNPAIFIVEAAGVATGEDVYRMICAGADASGGTSGVLNAPNPVQKLEEKIKGMLRAKSRKTGK